MVIKTSDTAGIKPFIDKLYIPPKDSHKGQNGKVLIIGGSSLFHAASIWAAETASYFVDMVHYSSTEENNEVFLSLKKKFINGIIVSKSELKEYVKEDDAILIGPGMVRGDNPEATEGRKLVKQLIEDFPTKKFVFDAGALQVMDKSWLKNLKVKPILTPHQGEFTTLFNQEVKSLNLDEKIKLVEKTAKENNCIILLKAVNDIVSDGTKSICIEGGNAGLAKGGSGDVLAGLTTALFAKNEGLTAAVAASYVLKKTADRLSLKYGDWYNVTKVVDTIPQTLFELTRSGS